MPLLTINLGEKDQTFETKDELKVWLEEQEERYRWYNDARKRFEHLIETLDNNDAETLRNAIHQAWKKLNLPIPGSQYDDALADLAKHNPEVATKLGEVLKNRKITTSGSISRQQNLTTEQLLGNAYGLFYLYAPHDTKHVLQQCDDFKTHLDALEKQTSTAKNEVENFLREVELQPAYEYWEKKANNHKTKAWLALAATIGAAVVAVIAFVKLMSAFSEIGGTGANDSLGLTRFPLTLFAAAVTLWMPRAAYKIFVMHNHLREHAEERMAIVHTYLNMVKYDPEFKAEGRRALIEQLFQGGQTGLVNEKMVLPFTGWTEKP